MPAADPAGESENDRQKRIQLCQDSISRNAGRLFVFGVLQRANCRNRNGRVYPKHILKREAERFYETHVTQNRALGELDHPNPHSETFRSLTLENVSHRVLDYYWDGDDLVGYVEVLPTPAGAMLKDLYLAGCRLGMSSRGWATLKEKDGCVYIQDDFELITFDFVSDPSTEGAFLLPVQDQMDVPLPLPFSLYSSHYNFEAPAQASPNCGPAAPIDTATTQLPMQIACEGAGDRNSCNSEESSSGDSLKSLRDRPHHEPVSRDDEVSTTGRKEPVGLHQERTTKQKCELVGKLGSKSKKKTAVPRSSACSLPRAGFQESPVAEQAGSKRLTHIWADHSRKKAGLMKRCWRRLKTGSWPQPVVEAGDGLLSDSWRSLPMN